MSRIMPFRHPAFLICHWKFLSSPQDLAKLDEFVGKISEKLDVFHGYIGLAAIPPHNYYDGAPYEYGVCRENFGG